MAPGWAALDPPSRPDFGSNMIESERTSPFLWVLLGAALATVVAVALVLIR
jgi:hypothetical protein